MNLSALFQKQKELDERIVKEKGLEGQDLLPQKILALLTELGELSNEWRGFKFWSEDKAARTSKFINVNFKAVETNPMLEEYVDCLHFILSIGNDIQKSDVNIRVFDYSFQKNTKVTDSLLDVFSSASELDVDGDDYQHAFSRFIELGTLLGFTWEQIETAYYAKNEINHSRQENNY